MGLLTASIGLGLRTILTRRIAKLSDERYWAQETARLQIAQLRWLLRRAAGTRFGRERGFAALAERRNEDVVAAYRAVVPARDYEGFRADVATMRDGGEADVLWPGVVKHYAQTSGTTAGDKYIPVSAEMLTSNRRAAMDIFAHAARFGVSLPGLLTGKVLFLGGSTDLETNAHGIATGDLSGLVTPMIRWPLSAIYLPGKQVALMSHWPSKIDAMARACVHQDVRMISGMPSWMLVLFERVMALARKNTIREVWPNLQLVVHGGVKYAPFEPRVRQAYSGSATGDDVPTRLELYPASEGFIALQDRRGNPGLRLLADIGNFYEFIPLERVHDAEPPAFTADAVERGQKYVVCMSTCAGLWRYIIGDVVEFDAVPAGLNGRGGWGGGGGGAGGAGPSRLRIVGRHKHFINAFGENLIVEHVENAVAEAAKATGLLIGEFTAAPVYPGPGTRAGLQLAVEIEGKPGGADGIDGGGVIDRFATALDDALKAQNVDYTTKRTASLGMAPPTVTPLEPGTFHRWMASRGKLGGQHKCPRCANHRELIEDVLSVRSPRV